MNESKSCLCVPPDGSVAAGPVYVVEMINTAEGIFTKQGTLTNFFTLNAFYNTGDFLSDPRVLYDTQTGRFIATELDVTLDVVYIAVSNSSDPFNWRIYSVAATGIGLADQPLIGVTDDKIVISTNDYDTNFLYVGVQYWVLNKAEIIAGLASVDVATFGPSTAPFNAEESVHPAQALSPDTTMYMVTSGGGDLSATTPNAQLITIVGVPPGNVTVNPAINLPVTGISTPPKGLQPGTTSLVDAGDQRILDASWFQGKLWFGFDNACTPAGDNATRSCIRLTEIDTSTNQVLQDMNFSAKGMYYFYPGFRFDSHGSLDMVFGYSSQTNYPSLAVTGQGVGDPVDSMIPALTIVAGTANDTTGNLIGRARYGDYFGSAVDPTDPTIVWVEGEYHNITTGDCFGGNCWSTFIASMRISGASLTSSPSYLNIGSSSSATSTVTTTSLGTFAGNVSLTASVSPNGPTASLSPTSFTLTAGSSASSTLTVQTNNTPAGLYNVTVTATSGSASYSNTVSVRVGADFSIAASPTTLMVQAGSSLSSQITLTSQNGFAGNVSLGVSIPVAGPTASLNPASVALSSGGSSSSTLTVDTTPSSPTGIYIVTVISSSGSLSHFVNVLVQVTNFAMSATPSEFSVLNSGQSTINVVNLNNSTITVSLSVSASGMSASLSPTSVTIAAYSVATSTLSVSSSTQGIFDATVTGSAGTTSHSVLVTVAFGQAVCITDVYASSLCPGSWTLNGPNTTPSTQLKVGIFLSSTLSFSFFSVTLLADSSILKPVSVDMTGSVLPNPTVEICIADNGGPSCGPRDNANTVTVGAFTLGPTFPTSGLLFSVVYNITGVTSSTSLGFQTGCTTTSEFGTTDCVYVAYQGNTELEVGEPATFANTGAQPSVALSANPSVLGPVPVGSASTSNITATSVNGFPVGFDTGQVSFSAAQVSGLGGTGFNPTSVTLSPGGSGSTTLTVFGGSPGNYSLALYGMYTVTNTTTGFTNTLFATLTVRVIVTDFSMAVSPTTVNIQQGSSGTTSVSLTSLNQFTGTVSFAFSSSTGISGSFNPASVTLAPGGTGSSVLTITVSLTKATGNYSARVTGTSGSRIRSVLIVISVSNFRMSESPSALSVQIDGSGQVTVTATSINGYSGSVVPVINAGLPSCVSYNFSPAIISLPAHGSSSSTLTLNPGSSCTVSSNAVSGQGNSGSTGYGFSFVLNITDFSVSANPTTVIVLAGSSGLSNVTVAPLGGFTGTVSLSSSVPSGIGCSLTPSSITLGAAQISNLSCISSTAGNYTVTVTGASGSLSHSTSVKYVVQDFSVSAPGSTNCLVGGRRNTCSFSVTVTSLNGFAGTVSLSSTAGSVNPTQIKLTPGGSGTATVTFTPGPSTVIVTYTSGTLSHQTSTHIVYPR